MERYSEPMGITAMSSSGLVRLFVPIGVPFTAAHQKVGRHQFATSSRHLFFERLAASRDKEKVLDLARRGHTLDGPSDVLKNPFVLEFLGLHERDA